MKLPTLLTSCTKRIFTKILDISESLICLLQQLFANKDFCIETRLLNIFKPKNFITAKTILESPYKVLQGSSKRAIFKRPIQSS